MANKNFLFVNDDDEQRNRKASKKWFFVQELPVNSTVHNVQLQQSRLRSHAAYTASAKTSRDRSSSRRREGTTPNKKRSPKSPRSPRSPRSGDVPDTSVQSTYRDIANDTAAIMSNLGQTFDIWMETYHAVGFRRSPGADLLAEHDGDKEASHWITSFESILVDIVQRLENEGCVFEDIALYKASLWRAAECFRSIIIPSKTPVHKIFNLKFGLPQFSYDVTLELDVLHSWIAVVHAFRWASEGDEGARQDCMRHYGLAMSKLRKRLQNPGTSIVAVVSTMSSCAYACWALEDEESHMVHKQHLASIISANGGLDRFEPESTTMITLRQFESLWAASSGWLAFPEMMPSPESLAPCDLGDADVFKIVTTLPVGFQNLAFEGVLSTKAVKILARIREAHVRYPYPGASDTLKSDEYEVEVPTYADLIAACPAMAVAEANLEKYLCLAVLVYCFCNFASARAGLYFDCPRDKLTVELLHEPYRPRTKAEQDCLTWIWFVVIDAWFFSPSTGSTQTHPASQHTVAPSLKPEGQTLLAAFKRNHFWLFDPTNSGSLVGRTLDSFYTTQQFTRACTQLCQ